MLPILKLWPDAKFIIALRDPLSMLPSLHARLLVTGDETIRDFPEAWAEIDERAQGRSIPKQAIDPRWLRYDEAGKLGSRVQASAVMLCCSMTCRLIRRAAIGRCAASSTSNRGKVRISSRSGSTRRSA